MTELALDIHEEILLRVQVNDLIRCKSVCKSWYSLISSPRFVKSHLDHILNTNEIGDTRIVLSNGASIISNDCFYSNNGGYRLVGSSNGLVCISRYDTDFLVVNPSTRELRKLPQSDYEGHYVVVSGFGYDSSIDDFKVVIGYSYMPIDYLMFQVLELKTNIWRELSDFTDVKVLQRLYYSVFVGNGILCNGALHWPLCPNRSNMQLTEIVSFDLSREVFKEISLPKLDGKWNLGTMKDRLCVFGFPNINVFGFPNINIEENYEEIEIWVMRNDNVQVPWERKLLPPGYDANKITMDYIPHKNFLSSLVDIWFLEEGSGAPVLVRSIDHPHSEHHEHIRLSTYSECNYKFDEHVFVRSLVSPHGNGNCNEGRVKRKRQNVVSPDGDGRSVKSRRESHVSHSSDGGRAKSKSQINVSTDSDGDERRVERKRRDREWERESLVYHTSNRRRAKIKRKSLVSSDSDDDGRRVGKKRGERESLAFHSSDGARAKRKRQRHVSSDYGGDGRVERKRRERESLAFYGSEGVRAKRKRQRHVSSDSDGDGRRVERKRRERESLVFHSSDGERAKSKRQSHVSSDSDDDERRVERRRRRDRERSQIEREMPKAMRGDTREKGRK